MYHGAIPIATEWYYFFSFRLMHKQWNRFTRIACAKNNERGSVRNTNFLGWYFKTIQIKSPFFVLSVILYHLNCYIKDC